MNNSQRHTHRFICATVLGYVVAVLAIDCLAVRQSTLVLNWDAFQWMHSSGVDVFKLIAWLIIPLAGTLLVSGMDKRYFTFERWKRIDWVILVVVAVCGMGAVALILVVPSLQQQYPGTGDQPFSERLDRVLLMVCWTISWLTGWEFMHRYLLIRHLRLALPKWGWKIYLVLTPLIEVGYHVAQGKPALECVGMGALSIVFCSWVVARKNAMLPFLGHLVIEIELILVLFFT